jgi:hypothetical protein
VRAFHFWLTRLYRASYRRKPLVLRIDHFPLSRFLIALANETRCDISSARFVRWLIFAYDASLLDHLISARSNVSEGGVVRMPLAETFWARRFGMLINKFGIPWMVNCEKPAA